MMSPLFKVSRYAPGTRRVERFSGRANSVGARSDHGKAADLARCVSCSDESATRMLPWVGSEAEGLVKVRWWAIEAHANFRNKVFNPVVREALGERRHHTWATLHLSRGTPLKWIQAQGGWTIAKVLLDTYGHWPPTESRGFVDALTTAENAPQAHQRPGQLAEITLAA